MGDRRFQDSEVAQEGIAMMEMGNTFVVTSVSRSEVGARTAGCARSIEAVVSRVLGRVPTCKAECCNVVGYGTVLESRAW